MLAWAILSSLLALVWAVVCFLVVLPFAGDGYTGGEYFVVVLFAAFAWPFYLAAVHWASRKRHFRRWALGLAVILALPFNIGSLFVAVPEIFAATLAYLLIGLTVPRPVPEQG